MPKRKRETVAGDNPEVGFGRGGARGGAGRGQGRKAAAKPFGTAAAAAEQTAATPEQKSISELLGMRKKPKASASAEIITWTVEAMDADVDDRPAEHKQHKNGAVTYTIFAVAKPAVLLAKGSEEDVFHVSPIDSGVEVDASIDGAVRKTRVGKHSSP